MGEPVGQFPVISQKDQALGVSVQSPHVKKTVAAVSNKVPQRGPAFGVTHRADDATRLVERKVDQPAVRHDPVSVDSDHSSFGVHSRPLSPHNGAVYLDPSGGDQLLAGSP